MINYSPDCFAVFLFAPLHEKIKYEFFFLGRGPLRDFSILRKYSLRHVMPPLGSFLSLRMILLSLQDPFLPNQRPVSVETLKRSYT